MGDGIDISVFWIPSGLGFDMLGGFIFIFFTLTIAPIIICCWGAPFDRVRGGFPLSWVVLDIPGGSGVHPVVVQFRSGLRVFLIPHDGGRVTHILCSWVFYLHSSQPLMSFLWLCLLRLWQPPWVCLVSWRPIHCPPIPWHCSMLWSCGLLGFLKILPGILVRFVHLCLISQGP